MGTPEYGDEGQNMVLLYTIWMVYRGGENKSGIIKVNDKVIKDGNGGKKWGDLSFILPIYK